MKKVIAFLLVLFLLLNNSFAIVGGRQLNGIIPFFSSMSDQLLLEYLEDSIYYDLVTSLDSDDFFVENIEAIFISKEYLEEVEYNSKANIYFGFSLESLQEQFQDNKFVFRYDQGLDKTIVEEFSVYDDSYDTALRNVAVGAGVIFVCITVHFLTGGVASAAAVNAIFAVAAKSASVLATSSGVISGVTAGIVTGIKTKDFDEALKSAAVSGSEGFMWGAITGAISGGVYETFALKGATINGLTMNEAALIQKQSRYPLDVIKQFSSMEQYEICKKANLFPALIDGKTALVRRIDLNYVDELGSTNLQRMARGLAPIDPETGNTYQLHHIGQKMDSTLAILTEAEHMQGGNNKIWHILNKASEIDRDVFSEQRRSFWKAMAEFFIGGN